MVACIARDKAAPRMKVLVTLASGANAWPEFPLDGPEAGERAAFEVEDSAVNIGEQVLGALETIRVNASAHAGEDLLAHQETHGRNPENTPSVAGE